METHVIFHLKYQNNKKPLYKLSTSRPSCFRDDKTYTDLVGRHTTPPSLPP